jgi:hypothetical protein
MVESIELLQAATANPVIMGAVLTLVFNIGGYIGAMLKVKSFESYDKYKALETLALFETVFIALQGVVGIDSKWVAVIAIAVNVIYGLKKALQNKTP